MKPRRVFVVLELVSSEPLNIMRVPSFWHPDCIQAQVNVAKKLKPSGSGKKPTRAKR